MTVDYQECKIVCASQILDTILAPKSPDTKLLVAGHSCSSLILFFNVIELHCADNTVNLITFIIIFNISVVYSNVSLQIGKFL